MLRDFRVILCDLGIADDEIRLIVDDAGIDRARVEWGSTAEVTWHNLISSLHKRRELLALLEVISSRHPHRQDLRESIGRYRSTLESAGQGIPRELLQPGEPSSAGPIAGVINQAAGSGSTEAVPSAHILPSIEGATIGSFASPPYLDPPVLPVWISTRAETLNRLLPRASSATWIIIQGGARTGKTILARLMAGPLGGVVYWVRLGGMDGERAAVEVDRALAAITRMNPGPSRDSWYSAVCDEIGAGKVLAIEDLPELDANHPLWVRLEAMIRVFRERGVRLLSTTLKPVPSTLLHQLGEVPTLPLAAPPLTEGETQEVLNAHGAPPAFVSEDTRLIHLFCREHPFLIVAACLYLRKRAWHLGNLELEAIVGAAHTDSIAQDVLLRLRATIPDGDTRKLLYRLSLVGERFDAGLVDELASVNPPIDRARERLHELDGPWLEGHPDGHFEVSPLLMQIGREQISPLRRKNCHRKIGLGLMRGDMDQHRALRAISHLTRAEEFDKAGTILVLMLAAAGRETRPLPDDAIFRVWSDQPLPSAMDLNIRLLVRGAQLAAFRKLGRPPDYPLDDLIRLQHQADRSHRFGLSGALSYGAIAVSPASMLRLCTAARTYLNFPAPTAGSKRQRRGDRDLDLRESESYTFERVILVLVCGIETAEHLQAWVELVALLPLDQRRRLFWAQIDVLSFPAAGDFLIGAELRKPPSDRDWGSVLRALEEMTVRSLAFGCDELWASAVRSRILVLCAQLGDLDAALQLAEASLGRANDNALARFLINSGIGERLVLAGEDERAWPFLEDALAHEAIPPFHEKMTALLAASRVAGSVDPDAAVNWARKAVAVAEHLRAAVPLEEVKALAELAIAQFQRGGVNEAFPTWERAAGLLLDLRNEGEAWKDLFVLFGHATGYLARLASSNEPPAETADGEEYVSPSRGMFLGENRGRLAYFRESSVQALPYLISAYAAGIGNHRRAAHWRERTLRDAPSGLPTFLLPGIIREDVPERLRAGQIQEVIHQSRRAASIVVVFGGERNLGAVAPIEDQALEGALAALEPEARLRVDSLTVLFGVLPTVLYLSALDVEETTRPRAQAIARELIGICRALPRPASCPAYWDGIVQPLEMAFIDRTTQPEILRWKGTLGKVMPEREALIFLSMATNATAEEAITVLLPILQHLESWYPPRSEIHRSLLVPYVEGYWTSCFRRMRFRFRSPHLVAMLLEEARQSPEEKRVRAILKAVLSGFTGRPPEELGTWLAEVHPPYS